MGVVTSSRGVHPSQANAHEVETLGGICFVKIQGALSPIFDEKSPPGRPRVRFTLRRELPPKTLELPPNNLALRPRPLLTRQVKLVDHLISICAQNEI